MNKLANIIRIFYLSLIVIILLLIFIINNNTARLIILPFIVCIAASLGEVICKSLNKDKLSFIFKAIYLLSFFSYWFGFLICFDYLSFRDKSYSLIFLSIPFYLVGVYFMYKIYKNIKEKNK